ncbi:MAG: hypothetical protein AMS26_04510 [Bacteroides sp. SM23_62]|nr:MAG: hypothetical protein AMS26_04510 [Bacteroides sp. SM23_62]
MELPPSGTIRISIGDGKTLKLKTNQTNYITRLLFYRGYLNFEYTNIFISLIRKINSFYDIGANIGFYSLMGAKINETLKVTGFEPATGPSFYFNENVRLNNLNNIITEKLALSHKEGEIEFYEVKNPKYKYLQFNLAGEGNTGSKTSTKIFEIKKVKTTTLDKYVQDNEADSIGLIKIDTEGNEHLILENAVNVLSNMKPIIICETLFNTIEQNLEKLMGSYGYEFYNHIDSGLKKVKTIVRKRDDGVRNCFFVHPDKFHLIEEYVH